MNLPFEKLFLLAVAAGEPLIRVDTDDAEETERVVRTLSLQKAWTFQTWNAVDGLRDHNNTPAGPQPPPGQSAAPLRLVLLELLNDLRLQSTESTPAVLAVRNLQLALALGPEPLTTLLEVLGPVAEERHIHLVAPLPPGCKLPDSLATVFHAIRQPLPAAEDLRTLLKRSFEEFDQADPAIQANVTAALSGLTRRQAKAAVGSSLALGRPLDRQFLWQQKANLVASDGLVELHQPRETFADLGGCDGIHRLLTQLISNSQGGDLRAKGAILLGPPGSGKSHIAKALAGATGRPLVIVNPGRLMGGLVGDTERMTRRCFDLLDVLAPCICLIDEVGKVMPKYGASGDSGVSNRLLGSFLTYMNDTQADVFWAFTANEDALDMNEAFTRAERVDLKFYVGLPNEAARTVIWDIYRKKYFPDDDRTKAHGVDDDGWTGAEIKACCRLARLTGRTLADTADLITPVAKVGAENLRRLETYAVKIGALDADTGRPVGVAPPGPALRKPRRAVSALA